jgi:hypothetical protein
MTQPRPRRDAGRAGRRPARRFAGHGGTGPSWWPRPARTSTRCTAGAGSAPGAPLGPDLHQAQPHNLDRGRGFGGWRAFRPLLLAQNVGNQGTNRGQSYMMKNSFNHSCSSLARPGPGPAAPRVQEPNQGAKVGTESAPGARHGPPLGFAGLSCTFLEMGAKGPSPGTLHRPAFFPLGACCDRLTCGCAPDRAHECTTSTTGRALAPPAGALPGASLVTAAPARAGGHGRPGPRSAHRWGRICTRRSPTTSTVGVTMFTAAGALPGAPLAASTPPARPGGHACSPPIWWARTARTSTRCSPTTSTVGVTMATTRRPDLVDAATSCTT